MYIEIRANLPIFKSSQKQRYFSPYMSLVTTRVTILFEFQVPLVGLVLPRGLDRYSERGIYKEYNTKDIIKGKAFLIEFK